MGNADAGSAVVADAAAIDGDVVAQALRRWPRIILGTSSSARRGVCAGSQWLRLPASHRMLTADGIELHNFPQA
jgi:hypothetical protein